jgi:hypothetical protein
MCETISRDLTMHDPLHKCTSNYKKCTESKRTKVINGPYPQMHRHNSIAPLAENDLSLSLSAAHAHVHTHTHTCTHTHTKARTLDVSVILVYCCMQYICDIRIHIHIYTHVRAAVTNMFRFHVCVNTVNTYTPSYLSHI